MKTKAKCQSCNRIYLGGRGGLCERCLSNTARKKMVRRLRCLCGKPAIVVILTTVFSPEEEPLELELPLCRECLALERSLETVPGLPETIIATNPAQIVVVKSLPRALPVLKGRKI
jgi:hypothetical protein